jgi:hypothetical protein
MALSNNIDLKTKPHRLSLMKTQPLLLTLLLLFFLINLLSRYLGEYGPDSIDQYRQSSGSANELDPRGGKRLSVLHSDI